MTTKRLGRGLGSLLSQSQYSRLHEDNTSTDNSAENNEQDINQVTNTKDTIYQNENTVYNIDINNLRASIYQPRKSFNDDSLMELSESIKEHGLLEPLLVKKADDGFFEIICGERRFRASKIAGLLNVPCLVKDNLKENAYAIALIENMQREDLNPLEQSEALAQMLNECSLTQEALAKTLGKSRSTITNLLRLNTLGDISKNALREGAIDLGHAKALLSLDGDIQDKALSIVLKKSMSVRETENFVKSIKNNDLENAKDDNKNHKEQIPDMFTAFESNLKEKIDEKCVKFVYQGANKGKITLSYKNEEEFNKIKGLLGIE